LSSRSDQAGRDRDFKMATGRQFVPRGTLRIGMRIGPRPKDRAPFIGQRCIADLPRGEISFQRRYNIMNFIR
jgi:hypothetical protein